MLITPKCGPRVRLISVLAAPELEVDAPFKDNICSDRERFIAACPTKALEPYKVKINQCMTYSAENRLTEDAPKNVKEQERQLVQGPSLCSCIECTICLHACPIGKPNTQQADKQTWLC